MILIFDVWRLALQLFTVGNRQELVIYGGKPSAAGQAGPDSTDSGPHEPSWPDYRRTFYIYINRKYCLWGNRSLSWHSEPLSNWRRTVTYYFPPSVWISPLFTVMWRRRHLSTVINGVIFDWRRMCTTLYKTICMVISLPKIPSIHCIYLLMYGSGQPYIYVIFGREIT